MPQAQFKTVYAVSSEDAVHTASNLLKMQPGRKWKCRDAGEKSAFVVLQLDRPQKITGIDIGNEHSAFASVSVGNLPYKENDFKEILITSSFMTPIESKNSTTTNRVRCFAKNALVESVADEHWELVKVACTQPFNRHIQYGLSFITLHIADGQEAKNQSASSKAMVPDKDVACKTVENPPKVGMLLLREDSPESDSESSSTLFNRWKQTRKDPISAAAAIRAASNPTTLKDTSESLKPSKVQLGGSSRLTAHSRTPGNSVRDRNRDDLLYDKDDEIPNERLERKISDDQKRLRQEKEAALKDSQQKKKLNQSESRLDDTKDKSSRADRRSPKRDERRNDSVQQKRHDRNASESSRDERLDAPSSSRKRQSSPINPPTTSLPKKQKQLNSVQYRPFKQLLQGVVLVISGIQNPDRGVLRQKAIDLGVRYKPDWDSTCTHLICAFKNTPKYNQVKGKGKIITRHWIEKCHSLKKRLPWRRFALDDRDADQPESEDEICDLSLKPPEEDEMSVDIEMKSIESPRKESSPAKPPATSRKETQTPPRPQSMDDDVLIHYDEKDNRNYLISSGSDTDEDIQKHTRKKETPSKQIDEIKSKTPTKEKQASPEHNEIKMKSPQEQRIKEKKKKFIVYEASTDEDDSIKLPNEVSATSPKLFDGFKFYLSDNLAATDLTKIKQYIKQFKGKIVEHQEESDYLISKESIKTVASFKGEIVSPLWILECYDMECRIPTRRYLL